MQKHTPTNPTSGQLHRRNEPSRLPDIPTSLVARFVLNALQETRATTSAPGRDHPTASFLPQNRR